MIGGTAYFLRGRLNRGVVKQDSVVNEACYSAFIVSFDKSNSTFITRNNQVITLGSPDSDFVQRMEKVGIKVTCNMSSEELDKLNEISLIPSFRLHPDMLQIRNHQLLF